MEADVFILLMKRNYASTTALSTKMLEYMAYGRSVVVIGQGVAADLIKKSGGGISVTESQLMKAADFLCILAGDRPSVLRIGSSGQDYIQRNLSVDQIGKKFSELFRLLLDEKN